MVRGNRRHICLIFFGDFRFDGRGYNIANSLLRAGHRVTLIATTADPGPIFPGTDCEIKRIAIRSWKSSKLRFLEFYIRSITSALRVRADLYQAEDLFSLPVAWLASRFHRGRLSYDCRELYFALGSLMGRRWTQAFWRFVEKIWIVRADLVMVTAQNQQEVLSRRYRIDPPIVVRNHPPLALRPERTDRLREMFSIPVERRILLYQGMLHPGRGIFLPLEIVRRLSGCVIVYLAHGEWKERLAARIRDLGLEDRAFLFGPVPYDQLLRYTAGAEVGLALQEPFGENHLRARPNKVFEYIMAGIPVVASDFPPLRKAIVDHGVGLVADVEDLDDIVRKVERLVTDRRLYEEMVENCRRASQEFNWEIEEAIYLPAVSRLLARVT